MRPVFAAIAESFKDAWNRPWRLKGPFLAVLIAVIAVPVTVVAIVNSEGDDGERSRISDQVSAEDGGTVSLGSDITLRIPAGALSDDTTVTIRRASEEAPAPDKPEAMSSLGDAFEIDLAGAELTGPVTLTIAYDPDLLPEDMPGEGAFLAYYDEVRGEWVPVYGTADSEKHFVTVETAHLSWWSPFAWLWDKVTEKIEQGVESLFAFVGFPEAELPDCSGLPPKHMSLELNDVLLACIEATGTDGEARLKVVNNRAYSVLMSYPPSVELTQTAKIGSLSDGIGDLLLDAGLLGRADAYVPAAGEAHFLLQFSDAGKEEISSSSAREMLAIDMLMIWLGALGVDLIEHVPEVLDGVDCIMRAVAGDAEPTMVELWNVARECALAVAKPLLGSVFSVLLAFIKTGVLTIPALTELAIDDFLSDGRGEVTVAYSPPQVTQPEDEAQPIPEPPPEPPPPPPPEPGALESATGDPLGDWGCADWVEFVGSYPILYYASSGPDSLDITRAALRFLPDTGLLELELDLSAAVAPGHQSSWGWLIWTDDYNYFAEVGHDLSGELYATVHRTWSPFPGALYSKGFPSEPIRSLEVSGARLRMKVDPSLAEMVGPLRWAAVTSGIAPGDAIGNITCYDLAPNEAPLILDY